MTLREMLQEMGEIKSRYPIGTEPAHMDPEDGHRMAHLRKAIEQQARINQQRMVGLLYDADKETQQPALFAADYREVYQVLSPDFEEEGEGLGARIDRLGSETQITIDPIRRDEETGRAVRHSQYLGGVTLTFDELVTLLEEFGPLAYDQHPCAICRGAAAPGQQLCPACQDRARAMEETEKIRKEDVTFLR
ncbi:MAG: hypothetical protein U9R72_07430 [Chloroflexota bacterium]|nr:hypothetical protein [Chloroflexota bacterium]